MQGKITFEKGNRYIENIREKEVRRLKRKVHYKHGYKIIINGKFYEVADGKRLLHFGKLKHRPTLQEVWNKTIGLQEEEIETGT